MRLTRMVRAPLYVNRSPSLFPCVLEQPGLQRPSVRVGGFPWETGRHYIAISRWKDELAPRVKKTPPERGFIRKAVATGVAPTGLRLARLLGPKDG